MKSFWDHFWDHVGSEKSPGDPRKSDLFNCPPPGRGGAPRAPGAGRGTRAAGSRAGAKGSGAVAPRGKAEGNSEKYRPCRYEADNNGSIQPAQHDRPRPRTRVGGGRRAEFGRPRASSGSQNPPRAPHPLADPILQTKARWHWRERGREAGKKKSSGGEMEIPLEKVVIVRVPFPSLYSTVGTPAGDDASRRPAEVRASG